MNTNNKLPYFKSAVGFFSFFYSTNVKTKNVYPLAYNVPTLGEEADLELLNFQFKTNDK